MYFGEYPDDPRGFNALCVCPARGTPAALYRRIVLSGVPGECVPAVEGVTRHRLPDEPEWRGQLPDLDAMRAAYRALVELAQRPIWAQTLPQLAHLVAEEAGMPDIAAAASLLAMADMGLIEMDLTTRPVTVRRTSLAKAEPQGSAVWKAIQRWRV